MNKTHTISSNLTLFTLFFLGFLEFGAASLLILQIDPDPKNAIFYGYSPSRLALFFLAMTLALCLLALVRPGDFRNRALKKMESIFQRQPLLGELVLFSLALLAIVVLILPFETLGKYSLYFERARPLLFFLCMFPAQLSLNWINRDLRINWIFLRQVFVTLGILLALGGFILFSGLGITPEQEHWNIGGNPLVTLQLISILLIGVLVLGLFGLIKPGLFARKGRFLDLVIVFTLFVTAVSLWQITPVSHNEFSTRPAAPYFQVFPASDARVHDLGALAVLNGNGILFREYTDKPLYIVFLAILHVFAGYDYNLLTFLHICFLALMGPFLYILGKSFHSRFFGVILAGIVLVRQQNAILLSNVFNFNATPAQFLTEVPTLLGLIISTCALFYWIRNPEKSQWRALMVGGIFGAVSLVRLNPFLLILATPAFLFLVLHRHKKAWLTQSVSFALGCAILIVPWVITGKDQSGQSFLILKFQDIINVRYGSTESLPFGSSLISEDRSGSDNESDQAVSIAPLSAGPSIPLLDIHTFPGFVINHTLHNFVSSFLTLPDSLRLDDQKLSILIERPYWKLGIEQLSLLQIPFVFLNLCLLAIGLAWSWKRWKWAGLTPLFIFVVYSLSLGFGRTSGSRYLVPMDWVVDFYFALGLICLFKLLPRQLRLALEAEPESEIAPQFLAKKPAWMTIGAVVLIFCVAALIPAAQMLVPQSKALCQSVNLNELKINLPINSSMQSASLVYGKILHPEIKKDRLSFGLLTCQRALSFNIPDFHEKLDIGQRVIVGLSDDNLNSRLEFIALPPDGENPGRILWQAEPK
jgi:hypothetical protein